MCEKTVGEIISEARKRKGLSQRQLAKLAKTNNAEISKIEAGIRKNPNPRTLIKICPFIDVNYHHLMVILDIFTDSSILNPFIKYHYENLNLKELLRSLINILGIIKHYENMLDYCKNIKYDELKTEKEKKLLFLTIDYFEYKIKVNNDIINFIHSRLLVERNKIGLDFFYKDYI